MGEVKVLDIALGFKHGMALTQEGKVFSWGCGLDGKLGYQATTS